MASKLTEDEKKKATDLFNKYDKDKSGSVDKAEFVTMISELLDIDPKNTEKYIDFKFRGADKDGSGKMDLEEFLELYAKMKDNFNA